MRKYTQKKDKFEDLDPEFMDAVDAMDRPQIVERIAELYRNEDMNQRYKREDLDVQECKLKLEECAAPYKMRKAKLKLQAKVAVQKVRDMDAALATVALAEVDLEQSLDSALDTAKNDYSMAAEQYREATKANKLKIDYCLQMLNAKGGITPKEPQT